MNVFMIHGSFGSPYTHWNKYLKSELEKKKIDFIAPTFPTPQYQTYDVWSELLSFYIKYNFINSETIFVAHSCGCIFIARYLAENKIKCKGLITVAGYNNFFEDKSSMRELNIPFYVDSKVLKCIKDNVKYRVNFYGNNDPFIPQKYFVEFSKSIAAKSIVIEDGGHLNSYSGFSSFPKLLEEIYNCYEI